jgi:two-component system chemotaxis response regulator CheB
MVTSPQVASPGLRNAARPPAGNSARFRFALTREKKIPMPGHDVVVVGFSAGGIEALVRLVRDLPDNLAAALLVVHHFPPTGVSLLPEILSRAGPLPAKHAVDGESIHCGRIYVAPPDRHLLPNNGNIRLTRGPRENGHRPAIDPLFRTAAKSYGPRVIGVLLSGTLDDGAVGLMLVKQMGGIAIVQDPTDALYPGMPSSALEQVEVDHVVPVRDMAALLERLVREPAGKDPGGSAMKHQEAESPDPAMGGAHELEHEALTGPPSGLTCPDCGGALWELVDGGPIRYRCHVGHAYTAENMVAQQALSIESALWAAIRALEEKAELSRRLARRSRQRGWTRSAARFEVSERNAEQGADVIRQLVLSGVDDTTVMEEA